MGGKSLDRLYIDKDENDDDDGDDIDEDNHDVKHFQTLGGKLGRIILAQ